LAPGKERTENKLLYEHGDASWFEHGRNEVLKPEPPGKVRISFKPVNAEPRRGMDHVAPSRREGQARVRLDRVFHPSEGTGTAAGTLYHAWFEMIDWLEDGPPTEANLRETARKLRKDLTEAIWTDLGRLLASFRTWLGIPAISSVLHRSAY